MKLKRLKEILNKLDESCGEETIYFQYRKGFAHESIDSTYEVFNIDLLPNGIGLIGYEEPVITTYKEII